MELACERKTLWTSSSISQNMSSYSTLLENEPHQEESPVQGCGIEQLPCITKARALTREMCDILWVYNSCSVVWRVQCDIHFVQAAVLVSNIRSPGSWRRNLTILEYFSPGGRNDHISTETVYRVLQWAIAPDRAVHSSRCCRLLFRIEHLILAIYSPSSDVRSIRLTSSKLSRLALFDVMGLSKSNNNR